MTAPYRAPVAELMDAMTAVGLDGVLALPAFAGIDRGSVRDVLEGFGALASDVIAPSDRAGDIHGAVLDARSGRVVLPSEVAAAFSAFRAGGWVGLAAPEDLGGGGFPGVVATATHEMFAAANLALSLNPMLTQGAIELLLRWGSDAQHQRYLRRLIDGSWTGTMNLTEPDAGSDVGAVRTAATPLADGRWAISGTKIFITWGDHELTDNIVHLVLARTPDAPRGTKGLSLFVVPKFLVDDDGATGSRNAVHTRSLEHKLGIHASPTCVLEFEGAVGELLGPPCAGMAAMFSMMNHARLAIGVQGPAVGERSLQAASAYAHERRQGRSMRGNGAPSPIIEHPDVQRMLALIAVEVDATRLLTLATSVANDVARHHPDRSLAERAQRRADLFTPLAKAWPTEVGIEMASRALQVHGGMGYVEETGIAQRLRDIRIGAIYEGTNGIQAIDLVGRKVANDDGAALHEWIDEIAPTVDGLIGAADARLRAAGEQLAATTETLRQVTVQMVERFRNDRRTALAGATAYLELAATVVAGGLLARMTSAQPTERATARMSLFAAEHLSRVASPARVTFDAEALTAALPPPSA